jgi:hypothetical protein
MANQHSENQSHPNPRLSPGDAAFERLQRREALKPKDSATLIGPRAMTATPSTGSSAMPTAAGKPTESKPGPAAKAADAETADEATPRIMAMAAAFGFEVASDLLEPAKLPESPPAKPEPRSPDESSRIIAVAATLIDAAPVPQPRIAAPKPTLPALPAPARKADPVVAATNSATGKPPARVAVPPRPARPGDIVIGPPAPSAASAEADATAAKLEAALLDQLRSLEETLQVRPKPAPRTPPRRPMVMPRLAEPASPPDRSPFAPDPVRQRTYVDLREPAPQPAAAALDDAPWRKYLSEPRAPRSRPVPRPEPALELPAPRAVPSAAAIEAERKLAAQERRRGIRAMSAAAVLGLGVGLGLLGLARPFAEPAPGPATASADVEMPVVASAADAAPATPPAPAVNQALATLLADRPPLEAKRSGTAVIAEAGTPPEALVAAVAPVAPPSVSPPPLIRPPAGQPLQVARGVPAYGPKAPPLAYGPTAPTYDPVRQSLLRDAAEEAATEEAEVASADDEAPAERPATVTRGGRATISTFVNLRAAPDNGAPVVAVLAQGLSVKVLGCDYWCEIEAGGKRGYVYKKFVGR